MGKLIRWILKRHRFGPLGDVRRFCRDPVGVQTRLLRTLLKTAAETQWGRRYGFEALAEEKDVVRAFQQRVPLHHYEAFHEDHLRVLRGETDVCWPGRFRYVGTTAGTTSRGRVLPASEASLRNDLRFGRAAILSYLADTGKVGCLGGTMLSLPGRAEPHAENPEVLIGDMTACISHYCLHTGCLRKFFARTRILPEEIHNLADYDAKATTIADYMMDKDVRALLMMPSWGLTLIDKVVSRYNDTHPRSVKTLGEIWPRLELVLSGGVPLSAYRKLLEARIGLPGVHFLEMYSATEGSFAFQVSQADPAMLLHLDNGIFYEFVRFDEAKEPSPRRFTVADVEPGVDYLLVITTCNGLWAYHMEDVVRFTQVFPHRLIVVGRAGELLDSVGEFLFATEVRGAIDHACVSTGARVREFHLVPRPTENGRRHAHQWLVEFEKEPDATDVFGRMLDAYLREVSVSYDATRSKRGIDAPEVISLPPGAFHRWLTRHRRGAVGQAKVPIVSEKRDIAEEVLALARTLDRSE